MHGIHNHLESDSINALKSIFINLGTPNNPKHIKLAEDLTQEERDKFIALLTKYQEAHASSLKLDGQFPSQASVPIGKE